MKRTFLKQSLPLFIAVSGLVSCQQKGLDKADLLGVWELTSIYHPMIEEMSETRLKELDTMTVLDLGQIAMWQTDDVARVKELEREMILKDKEIFKKNIIGATYHFLNDTLMVRKSAMSADTNVYRIDQNSIFLKRLGGGSQTKEHQMTVTHFAAQEMKLSEKFVEDKEVLTEFTKVK